ncbi:MAG: respiratory nitrate reductase subunit gamma [Cellulomonadaceae bacterium]|jgi:nitrate reductase gamma subunit|nr:respiratory nitrate reductase subunit gamma [Cellulomonadaceae bacterium]
MNTAVSLGATDYLLWVALPYVAFVSLIVGTILRFRKNPYGVSTRSSISLEKKLLGIGAPLFHIGLACVLAGHVVGLLIPESWTSAFGITEEAYHLGAMVMGMGAAVIMVVGLVILVIRRVGNVAVWQSTTTMDKVMYVILLVVLAAGIFATLKTQVFGGSGYNYRETISPWLRSLFYFQPQPELMATVPTTFKVHITVVMVLFVLWPLTRLVHAMALPLSYLVRPYEVYRSADRGVGARAVRPGWGATRFSRNVKPEGLVTPHTKDQ